MPCMQRLTFPVFPSFLALLASRMQFCTLSLHRLSEGSCLVPDM